MENIPNDEEQENTKAGEIRNLYLSELIHKAVVETSEEGIEFNFLILFYICLFQYRVNYNKGVNVTLGGKLKRRS